MKANYEDKIPQATSEISLGNLYEINKQLMEKEPVMSELAIADARSHIRRWLENKFSSKYFMLLCHELRDYTVFNLDKTNSWKKIPTAISLQVAKDIVECMTNRGQILAINQQEGEVWELWIRNTDGCFAYYLFPYGEAVLEY